MTRLPAIDRKRKWLALGAGYAGFCALYMFAGRIHLGTARPLPQWSVDRFIPFIGWTIWIYYTQFLLLPFVVGALKTTSGISRTLYSMGAASAFSFCVFFFYPTTLPRPTVDAGGLTGMAFRYLYTFDTATNCFPSLHVSLAWLGALGVLKERARLGIVAAVWASLITFSTITTRQHYFIDVIAGVIVAGVCGAFRKRLFPAIASDD